MYEYSDKILLKLRSQAIKEFNKFKSLSQFEEISLIKSTKTLYENISKKAKDGFLDIGYYYYIEAFYGETRKVPDEKWVKGILKSYNPVTNYVFENEVERKRQRFFESILSNNNKSENTKTALRYWNTMISQYAIDISDLALLKAYYDSGAKKVIWISEIDNRTCDICEDRDGKIYNIDEIPPKPHWNCRCYYSPYKD